MYSSYDLGDYWWYQYTGKVIEGSRKKLYKNGDGLANLYNASYSTLKAGGGNDIICVKTKSDRAVVQCGAGNDYVTNYNGSGYCSFYGEEGDDEFRICGEGTYADGGADNDTFRIFGENQGRIVSDTTLVGGDGDDVFEFILSSKISIEGGTGNNVYRFDPFAYTTYAHLHNDVVITDISDDDTIEYFADWGNMGQEKSDGSELDWSIDPDSGFVVLYDKGWDFFSITLEDITDIREVAGVRYNATRGGTKTLGEIFGVSPLGGAVSLNAAGTEAKISADYKKDTFNVADYGTKIKTIDASATSQGIYITGNGLANKIIGGSGNDTICAMKGSDTLTGGKGNDIFIYKSGDGKETITDYAAGDKISLNAAIDKATLSGSDVVFTIGKGTLTLQKAKGKTITLIDAKGKTSSTVVGGSTTLTLKNTSDSAVKIDSTITKVNASSRTKAIKITGNTLNNTISGGTGKDTIYGGGGNDSIRGNAGNDKLYGEAGADKLYGGAGNDSLWGGAGNDSLWGNSGKDVFIYKPGEGTDRIFDYSSDEGDMLKILKTNGQAGGTFKNSNFDGDALTLTINGGGSVIFENVNAGDKININGKNYTIKGRMLK